MGVPREKLATVVTESMTMNNDSGCRLPVAGTVQVVAGQKVQQGSLLVALEA